MTRPTRIARLLAAALDEDGDLERRPIDEVQADLDALGRDPARAVALAKTLAERPGSPAARLLGRLAEDEDADEIEALERAPIGDVRERLPGDAAAALTAAVRRQVGGTPRVVPFRRRLRVLGIGSLVGLAAGLALVVLTDGGPVTPRLDDAGQPAREKRVQEEQHPTRLAEPDAAAEAPAAPAAAPPAASRAERELPAEQAKDVVRALSDEAVGRALLRSREERQLAPGAAEPPAFLLIDPALAPEHWLTLALPEGALDERLPAARRVAEGRPIVALVGYRAEARRREVVIVLGRAEDQAAADRSREALPEVLGPLPEAFEVLPLD